jgi:hypothetical protein
MASSNLRKSRTTNDITANTSTAPDLSFEDEFEIQKAKIDVFNDVISVREQLAQCRKDIEAAEKIIAENPAKITTVELDFMIASNDYRDWQATHSGHREIWQSNNVRTQDVVFGSHGTADASLTTEKLETMISLAKLNAVLLEEHLQLKKLPVVKEQKKAELDALKHAYHTAKKNLPSLVAKSVELEQDCRVAEKYWQERWAEEKKQQPASGNDNLVRLLEDRNRHQEKQLRNLEKEIQLLRSKEEWSSRISSSHIFDDYGPGPDIGNTLGKRGSERYTSGRGSGLGLRPDVRQFVIEQGSQQFESDNWQENREMKQIILPATGTFQYGAAIQDAEWIMGGLSGNSREKKTKWYIENYGRSPDYAWKVLRGPSRRYLDILDWHGALKQLLSLGVFESSAFKKEFEELFRELQFWTLGWKKEEWSAPQAMFDWVETAGRGNNLYTSLESEFNNAHTIHKSDGTSSRGMENVETVRA